MRMTGHGRQADAGSAEFGDVAYDQEQFARAFEDCRPHLLTACRRILGEPDGAQDAVNETYLRAYRNLAQFEPGNFPGWLSRIAKRICLDRMRRESPLQCLDAETEPGSTDSEVRILNAIQIRSILATLPEPQRRCLKLFYIEGFTAKEVARETRFTEKQVKSHLQNGRRNFLAAWNAMEDKGDE
jgi:RNA polymerase sigma-70 factor (ECF subfamily)